MTYTLAQTLLCSHLSDYPRYTFNFWLSTQAKGLGLLGTRWGAIDFNEPDLQLLIHHEVKAEELEALVREVLCADGGLHTHEAAPMRRKEEGTHKAMLEDPIPSVHRNWLQLNSLFKLMNLPTDYSSEGYSSNNLLVNAYNGPCSRSKQLAQAPLQAVQCQVTMNLHQCRCCWLLPLLFVRITNGQ